MKTNQPLVGRPTLVAAAYIQVMSTWTETDHPRNHVSGASRFSDKSVSAPEATLAVPGRGDVTAALQRAEDAKFARDLETTAKTFSRRYRYDDPISGTWEDIAQDAAVTLLIRRKRGAIGPLSENGGLIRSAVSSEAYTMIAPSTSRVDISARAMLSKAETAERLRLGRDLTWVERQVMADSIRLNDFLPTERPTLEYHLHHRPASLDAPHFADSPSTLGESLAARDSRSPFAEDSSALADLFDGLTVILENGRVEPELKIADTVSEDGEVIVGETIGRVTKSNVKRDLWNHFAAASGDIPQVRPERFTKAQTLEFASAVDGYPGGVIGLCTDWQDGVSTAAADASLFAPFGELGRKAQQKVVDQILHRPNYAREMFESALAISKTSKRNYAAGRQKTALAAG